MPDDPLHREVLDLLATHTGQPMDFVALYMFLNTVAGGHYQERHDEDALRRALAAMAAAGEIEAWSDDRRLEQAPPDLAGCTFRLGRT